MKGAAETEISSRAQIEAEIEQKSEPLEERENFPADEEQERLTSAAAVYILEHCSGSDQGSDHKRVNNNKIIIIINKLPINSNPLLNKFETKIDDTVLDDFVDNFAGQATKGDLGDNFLPQADNMESTITADFCDETLIQPTVKSKSLTKVRSESRYKCYSD